MMSCVITVTNNLANVRKAVGISQSELARRVGLSKNTISLYECGRVYPTIDVVFELAHALGCNPIHLYECYFTC